MTVAVLIPYRESDPARSAALGWVLARYAETHPDWPVVIGRHDDGGWCKAAAVADALDRTDADTLVIADADLWVDGLNAAVTALEGARWVVPHSLVHRLSEKASQAVCEGLGPVEAAAAHGYDQTPYRGVSGGGAVVLRRDTYLQIPLDPRFRGWGGEDTSWARAMRCLIGTETRLTADLWHLWHPPQERMSRTVGTLASDGLRRRYAQAGRDRRRMQRIIDEIADPDAHPLPVPNANGVVTVTYRHLGRPAKTIPVIAGSARDRQFERSARWERV